MVEHSTADREVPGSNPGAPSSFLFFLFLSPLYISFAHMQMSLRHVSVTFQFFLDDYTVHTTSSVGV